MRSKMTALVAAVAAAASAAGAAKWMRGRKGGGEADAVVSTGQTPPRGKAVGSAPAPKSPMAAPPTPAPAASTGAAAKSGPASSSGAAASSGPAASSVDGPQDLTAIKGLGKVKAARLVAAGITSYAQIAAWTDDDIAEVGLAVSTSPGQIKREDWIGQAKALSES